MAVKIPLRLRGIDLREPTAYERIASALDDLFFEANGGVSLAVVYTDDSDPVRVARDAARCIAALIPGVTVSGAHDELVSTADIAARCEVAAEAVRLWAGGKRRATSTPFPVPKQVVGSSSGGKTMSLYAWRDVLSWVREVIGIDPDKGVTYLDDNGYAFLNQELVSGSGWVTFASVIHSFTSPSIRAVAGTRHILPASRAEESTSLLLATAALGTVRRSYLADNVELNVPAAAQDLVDR